jgi:hypothetical protein
VRFLLPVAALVTGLLLASCKGGGHAATTSESVVNGTTSAATSAPAQTGATDTTLASDFNHISAADAARFDEASGRLQGELDAIVACMREDDSGCVYGERDGFRAALRDSAHNLTGPETRDNPCYQRLEDYDTVFSEIRTVSRWLFSQPSLGNRGSPPPLVTSGAEQSRCKRNTAT